MGLLRNISHLLAALFNDRAAFQRRWDHPPPDRGLEGRWQGQWVSEGNGHRGALKCLLTLTGPGEYEAAFHAVYAGFLRVAYVVPLHGRQDAGIQRLEGETDLGRLAGGIYHYQGEVTETAFNCAYRCRYDHGIFHLQRLENLNEQS